VSTSTRPAPEAPAPTPTPAPYARRRAADAARARRRSALTVTVMVVLLAPLLMGSVYVLSKVKHSSDSATDVIVEIKQGWTPAQVGDALAAAGVIQSSKEFQQVAATAQFTGYAVGRYDFVSGSSARAALDTLRGGPATQVPDIKLLLPPGLTVAQVAARVGKLEGKSTEKFQQALTSNLVRSKFQPTDGTSLEGLTWPDTYFIGAAESENEILARLVRTFDAKGDAVGLATPGTGLTPSQTVIVASLVEAEAGSLEDMPLIAAVIENRLKQGMPLQIDATLCYAKGGCPPVPTEKDKKIESPYNTYLVNGLPPTPIRTVSAASLKAALNPALVNYLYYVSDKNGKTYYAATLPEHERNVAKARSVG
jgi:UPF0755 protein